MDIAKRRLGKTDIEVTPIGLGCWQFGSVKGPMHFYRVPSQEEVDNIVKTALDGGINWFDTAEIYGKGASEKALAKALVNAGNLGKDAIIATKWYPMVPTQIIPVPIPILRRTARSITRTFPQRQECLSPYNVDLYQVHAPFSISSIESQMNEMAALVKDGKIRAVGVSNFSAIQMRRAHAALAKHNIPLASNQVHFSLLHRNPEKDGVLEAAKELNITIIAWSPLESGLLTERYSSTPELVKKMPFMRKRLYARFLEKSPPLFKALQDIAKSYRCTTSEVGLSWLINFHGDIVVAIPGATKPEHVNQNIGALKLTLTKQEMAKLDELSRSIGV